MSDFGTVQADGVHLAKQVRADATAYLTRTGNADLLPILGLADDPRAQPVRMPRGLLRKPVGNCPVCGNKLAAHGGCNRRKACREATHNPDGGARVMILLVRLAVIMLFAVVLYGWMAAVAGWLS